MINDMNIAIYILRDHKTFTGNLPRQNLSSGEK